MTEKRYDLAAAHVKGDILDSRELKRRVFRVGIGELLNAQHRLALRSLLLRLPVAHRNGVGYRRGDSLRALRDGDGVLSYIEAGFVEPVYELYRVRNRQSEASQLLGIGENIARSSGKNAPALVHNNYSVCAHSLVHVVGYEHYRNAVGSEAADNIHNIGSAARVEHGGRLIENHALRAHGEHAGYGDALLLTAGEQVRRVGAEFVHSDGSERLVHPLAYLLLRYAEIFRRKGDVLLDDVGNYLVIGILEHHAEPAADLKRQRLVLRVHAKGVDSAAAREIERVEMARKGALSGAVMPENTGKASLFDTDIDFLEHLFRLLTLLRRVPEGQVFGFYRVICHLYPQIKMSFCMPLRRAGKARSS